jgi:hypothetical protein
MAVQFIEGFDKYGPVNSVTSNVAALLTAGDWNTLTGSVTIVAGLSSTGNAILVAVSGIAAKTLSSNFSRLIAGVRFAGPLTNNAALIGFFDSGTAQCTVTLNTTGAVSVRTGAVGGTALATSSATVSANGTHYLEVDITFGASAAYQVWLDGVSILSGTGATKTSANSTANQVWLGQSGGGAFTADDLYLFDSSGGTNNAVLNSNPRIETQLPNADSSVQFSFGAAILGTALWTTNTVNAPGANQLFLRKFTAGPAGQLASVACIPFVASGTANFKAVVYADSAGSPTGSALATGAQVTGTVSGATLTSAFASPPTLSASTAYWLGFITDTSLTLQLADTNLTGATKSNTYGSGPPTNPSMTTSQASWIIYGNLTGVAVNYYETDINPPPGDISYVFSSSSGFEDLYSFPALTTTPNNIYTVAVKGNIKKSDTGARTITLQCKSGSTDSSGSAAAATPATTYGWMDSFFDTDPNTGSAWTATGLNSATSGVKVAS